MANKVGLLMGWFSLSLFSATSFAQAIKTVGELDEIQSSTILMKAKAKYEEEKNNYLKSRAENGDADGTLPVVKSILGTDKRTTVTFLYPGNVKVSAQPKDAIPGGYIVGQVDEDAGKVELLHGKERYMVGFSSTAPVSKNKPNQQANYGMPGVPPIMPR